ncbi:CIMIP2 protein CG18335 [Temnothorax nylanderi]|uniref:CIMIP2 protein CG18335 n=1 Tax=Temnothorax nylanderi TaxID=102681 RepID=UPI003A8744F7
MTAGMELLTTAEPHFIPGYSGYCPQYRFSCGETYAKATHKLLLDPTINHARTLVLANYAAEDYEAWRPSESDIRVVNTRFKRTDPLFVHPMLPGYEGFVPGTNDGLGQRYAVRATEGLADFERQQLRSKAALDRLRRTIGVQCGQAEPRNLEERLLIKTQFKLPLLTVRPEYVTATNNLPLDKKCEISESYTSLFYFVVILNILRKGYATHIPHGYTYSEISIVPSSDNVLYSFANCRKGTKYRMTDLYPDPPLLVQSTEIYHKNVGMIPNYLGYIPGAVFRCGKTFGADSRDVKLWLRRDSDL